ncbi:N-formylglutamate amidohydrolase [Variovorax guangxiensis]|uniref:N-formylglutamate amidohydrolase n=1 Tax=Variovorax guangxiensis TaxID=1775474 RepID=UPI00285A1B13|nr:N-formylglutamate amidohydrolase [Variovorax guangxiensis]MDR6859812.1 N-formylglutamate amidohydrolase [Variovorax guangxiensis]
MEGYLDPQDGRRRDQPMSCPHTGYPQWVVLHVPHDSAEVPSSVRGQFLLDEVQMAAELDRMTDHLTMALFSDPESKLQVVRAPVSRLVVDVERFACDGDEPMAARGMGAVYAVTSHQLPLRRPLSVEERERLMREYYFPHHARLEAAFSCAIQSEGYCLLIDCHSFPGSALPYELATPDLTRPDICIGTDPFHTSAEIARAFVMEFERAGWRVGVNDPFAGALVPSSRYRSDRRVGAVMVEVNRRLYLDERTAKPLPVFSKVSGQIKGCCMAAAAACRAPERLE